MKHAILIPAYQPQKAVLQVAGALKQDGFDPVVVVDDGSGDAYKGIFDSLSGMGCVVLTHPENEGKGAALKTGIRYVRDTRPDVSFVITCDADGQHLPEDIGRVSAAAYEEPADTARLILGTRDFSDESVPFRSRWGNRFSAAYFRLATGVRCGDTQTGLRAVPARLFGLALETAGTRYEYEMNFLTAAARDLRYVPITTVYEDGNSSSHFHAFRDSVRIYRTPLRYAAASLLSAACDLTLFAIFCSVFGTAGYAVTAATVGARILSGNLNFVLNRNWSFRDDRAREGSPAGQLARYAALFVGIMLASSGAVTLLRTLPVPLVVTKAFVDTALAVVSFLLQKNWVFRKSEGPARIRAGEMPARRPGHAAPPVRRAD